MLSGGPITRVRTVIRRPDSEKWNATEILNIVATPRRPTPRNTDQREPNSMRETKGFDIGGDGPKLNETPVQDPQNIKPREFRNTRATIKKFGATRACIGCESRTLGAGHHRNHTATWCARAEAKMIEDDEF